MRIARFVWDDSNEAHLGRHGVEPSEAEEAVRHKPLLRRGRYGRYLAYGSTADGRQLLVVFVEKDSGTVRVITARDLTRRERAAARRSAR